MKLSLYVVEKSSITMLILSRKYFIEIWELHKFFISRSMLVQIPVEVVKQILDLLELWPDIAAIACTCSHFYNIVKSIIAQKTRLCWDENYKKESIQLFRLRTQIKTIPEENGCCMVRANIGFTKGKHAWSISCVKIERSAAVTAGFFHLILKF